MAWPPASMPRCARSSAAKRSTRWRRRGATGATSTSSLCGVRAGLLQAAREAGDAGVVDEDATLAGALAVVLDAPVGAVADAAGLADHQVGRGQAGVELVGVVLQATCARSCINCAA